MNRGRKRHVVPEIPAPSTNRCIPNLGSPNSASSGSATYSDAGEEVFRTCATEPSTPRSISCNKWAGFTASQRSFPPIEPLPQVSDTDAVCVSELRCWKLTSVQSFSDLFVIRSDENGRLFDGYRDAVEQWRLRRHNVARGWLDRVSTVDACGILTQMARTCIFCDSPLAGTRAEEHAIPRWLM